VGARQKIRLVRADSGFFDDQLLSFLEQRRLPYIVVARLTPWIKREAQHVEQWRALQEAYAVGEFRLKLLGWQTARRFVVIRAVVREGRGLAGQIGSADYSRPRKFRERLERWLDLVRVLWPACPAQISCYGDYMLIQPAVALAAKEA